VQGDKAKEEVVGKKEKEKPSVEDLLMREVDKVG
jgi:hypothetical protein